jgi:bifunctional non-homologous end joining protein LigD
MSLKVYQQKRKFNKTPEPKGNVKHKSKNLYIIQKHDASHLHYDFRIELNGVLLSWAVPKGPSLDPSIKRLAMHVEDHPVEYGSFEGIIPKGQYGGGTVMLWDKGEWFSEDENPNKAYQKGSMTLQLKAEKLNGLWKLIRINKNDKTWLLIKIKDQYSKSLKKYDITEEEPNSVISGKSIDQIANRTNEKKISTKNKIKKIKIKPKGIKLTLQKKPFPNTLHPQLATLVDEPPVGENWLHEIKFDGYRLLAFKQGKKVSLFTRNNNDWTHKFKTLVKKITHLPISNCVLDGEIVVLDEDQHSNFQLLQNAIKNNEKDIYYYIFDLLYYEQYDLTGVPLIERKDILKKLLSTHNDDILRYSDHVSGSGKDIFKKTCELGLEGIVSKERDSFYSQRRDKNWLKVKCIKSQEFVIGGFLKSERRQYFRSLMLGTFNEEGKLIYCGNVGTGFTENSIKDLYQQMIKYERKMSPFSQKVPLSSQAIWLKPVLVAEIEFTEWTDNGTLRHPSFKGVRKDKPAKQITKESETPIENILHITHPNKVLYPEDKITKKDLANYYEKIQDWILPLIVNRPLMLLRCPGSYKKCFHQKHITHDLSNGLNEVMIKEKNGKAKYIYVETVQGLIELSQMNVLEIHPWNCKVNNIEKPDMIIFDLDPDVSVPWKRVVHAAFEIKDILKTVHLKSFVKTTGGKGLHVVVPITPEYNWNKIKDFTHLLVDFMVSNNPSEYIGKMTKSSRKNKIFIDYLRNQRGATSIAPYSTRARKGAPIATPLFWEELTGNFEDTFFTINTLPNRIDKLKSNPWKDFLKIKQSLNLNKLKF